MPEPPLMQHQDDDTPVPVHCCHEQFTDSWESREMSSDWIDLKLILNGQRWAGPGALGQRYEGVGGG